MANGRAVREWTTDLGPLPFSKVEAEQISKLFPEGDVTLLMRQEASETNVKTVRLDDYRMVHFASHGLIDAAAPAVFSIGL